MKTIYYNSNGKIDKISTWINNYDWILPLFVITIFFIIGIIEKL